MGDPDSLYRIMTILVGNAIKFTRHGKVAVRVTRAMASHNEVLLKFSVSDSGIGIAPENIPLIFQPFTQADNSTTRKFGGTGMGLAIASGLVQLMGGRIWAESEVDKGSTFHFTARFEPVWIRE
jgi:signal transduction histidine kinase